MNNNQKEPSLPNINKLFEKTWQIYNARLGTLLGITAVPMLIFLPLLIIALAAGFLSFVVSSAIFDFSPLKGLLLLWFVLGVIIVGITAVWSHLALIYAIAKSEEKPGIRESYGKVRGKIMSAAWISMLTGLIISAGYLFFIIPGIIFSIWFYFSFYVLVIEGLKGTKAMSRSKKLVSGKWWEVFVRMFLMMLVISVIVYLTSSISKAMHIPFIGSLFDFIVAPFPIIYSLLIYEDLKKNESIQEKSQAEIVNQ